MTEEIQFQSDMGVSLIDHMGTDNSVCNAARVSTGNHTANYSESNGLIRYLYRELHSSPFEHASATFLIDVPMFIRSQIHRHRVFSFNEISGRYSELKLKFWLPDPERPLTNKGSGAYPELTITDSQEDLHHLVRDSIVETAELSSHIYNDLIEEGVATEVARAVLPMNTYTQFYMTGNLWNWFGFIKKRVAPNAQEEVKEVAYKILDDLEELYPLSVGAFREYTLSVTESEDSAADLAQ